MTIAFNWQAGTQDDPSPQIEHTPPLRRNQVPAVAFSCKDHGADASDELAPTLRSMTHDGSHANGGGQVIAGMQVRRLTPVECARLQGFPDTYLDIPYRGKPAADGPKYKALGNSMAVPVMRWIGERIQMCADIKSAKDKP